MGGNLAILDNKETRIWTQQVGGKLKFCRRRFTTTYWRTRVSPRWTEVSR